MAEEEKKSSENEKEARRIISNYLNNLGWAREWRRTIAGELRAAAAGEERDDKFRECDHLEESAEEAFSREIERLRKDTSDDSTKVMQIIYNALFKRNDLTFFGKAIVGHLRKELDRRRII